MCEGRAVGRSGACEARSAGRSLCASVEGGGLPPRVLSRGGTKGPASLQVGPPGGLVPAEACVGTEGLFWERGASGGRRSHLGQ